MGHLSYGCTDQLKGKALRELVEIPLDFGGTNMERCFRHYDLWCFAW